MSNNISPLRKKNCIELARLRQEIHVLLFDPNTGTDEIVPLAGILALGSRTPEFFGFPTTAVSEIEMKIRPRFH